MKHLQRDMDRLHREILAISTLVEEMIDKALRALCERNPDLAREVIDSDEDVDQREVHIEEECLKMLALHQPVATDLRRIATVLKVNNDLERIADLAVNLAERVQCLVAHPEFPIPDRLDQMADSATAMVHDALNAFVNLDCTAARNICRRDEEVDEWNRQIITELQQKMQANVEMIVPAMQCFSASRHLERVADHATNIAEDILYLVEGEIARHQPEIVQSQK